MNSSSVVRRAATFALLLCALPETVGAGQAGRGSADLRLHQRSTPSDGVDRVWPEPPAPARIRFVRSLTPDAGSRRSFFRRLWDAVSGGQEHAVMAQPYGMVVGPLGRLYVADAAGGAVHTYDLRTGRYARLAVDASSIIGIAAIGDRLFVTDSIAGRVICIDVKGRRQWTIGREAALERPTGIVAAGDRLHIVDTLAHRVVTVSSDGKMLGHFGSRGIEPGQFNFPTSIARDRSGRLYVTDSMNFRVQIFSATGRPGSVFGKLGDGSGDFNRPKGIAVDAEGHIYVVEGFHDVVQIFDVDGRFLLAFGEPGHRAGEFWLATGIAIHDDRIYVADSANRRIQVFEHIEDRP